VELGDVGIEEGVSVKRLGYATRHQQLGDYPRQMRGARELLSRFGVSR
jgi:hypothetical protein